MKKIYLVISLIVLSVCAYSQSQDLQKVNCSENQIVLSGYLIRYFKKDEIKLLIKARKKRLKGKSFSAKIDSNPGLLFVPRDLGNNLSEEITYPERAENKIFLPCSKGYVQVFNEYFCTSYVECEWLDFFSDNFYKVQGNREYVYQIIELKGIWVKVTVSRDLMGNLFYKEVKRLNSPNKLVDLHLFIRSQSFQTDPILDDVNIKFWKMAPSLWK